MSATAPLVSRVRFGAYDLNRASGELRKSGTNIKLRYQAVQVLLMLTERAGQVVTREEIRERLWSSDTFVDFERSINFCINQIRAVLGDEADHPRYVETLPRRGYRFIAPVTLEVVRERASIVAIAPPALEPSQPTHAAPASVSSSAEIQVITPVVHSRAPRRTAQQMAVILPALIALSLAGGFAIHKWLSTPRIPSLQDLKIRMLTNSGAVTDVAISPDGRHLAYSKIEGNDQGLWLLQISAQTDVRILSPGSEFHGLTFSPDGNFIYFVRSDEKNPFFKYLYSMPSLGGPVRKLLVDVDSPVSFSPDGRRFVYEHCVEGRDDIELKIAAADGSDDHVLAILHHGSNLLFQPGPSWSPDGATIAVPVMVVAPQGRWVLDAVSVTDGSVRELVSRSDWIGRPVWLQQGHLLVPLFDSFDQRAQIWSISFPEGRAQRLTNDLTSYGSLLNEYGFPLDASRDRKNLTALAAHVTGRIWQAPASEPAGAREILSGDLTFLDVAEAEDQRLWATDSAGQLWIMNPDGSQPAPYGEFHDVVSISSCGKFMILERGASVSSTKLTRIDSDGKNPTDLVTGSLYGPACSPNSKSVFYTNAGETEKIFRVDIGGGPPVEIARVLGDQAAGSISISPDGTLIAYVYSKYVPTLEWNVAIISARDGATRKTFQVPTVARAGPYWSLDGKGLLFLWDRDRVTNLWEQPFTEGKPRQLTKFTTGQIFEASFSSDHKRLLFTRGEIRSDAVLLTNTR